MEYADSMARFRARSCPQAAGSRGRSHSRSYRGARLQRTRLGAGGFAGAARQRPSSRTVKTLATVTRQSSGALIVNGRMVGVEPDLAAAVTSCVVVSHSFGSGAATLPFQSPPPAREPGPTTTCGAGRRLSGARLLAADANSAGRQATPIRQLPTPARPAARDEETSMGGSLLQSWGAGKLQMEAGVVRRLPT